VHKIFYASGFIYSPASQQILLHQPSAENNVTPFWKTIGGVSLKNESPEEALQRIVYESLKLKINMTQVLPVYNYFHTGLKKIHYVFYTEVEKIDDIKLPNDKNFTWFFLKQLVKLPFEQTTKQDLTVVERVVKLKERNMEEALYQANKKA